MARHRVVYAPEAQQDLVDLYKYIDERSGADRARAYTARIEACCRGLADFSTWGRRRDDLFPGLRAIGFERRVTIMFHNTSELIIIDRILYGGRDMKIAFEGRSDQ